MTKSEIDFWDNVHQNEIVPSIGEGDFDRIEEEDFSRGEYDRIEEGDFNKIEDEDWNRIGTELSSSENTGRGHTSYVIPNEKLVYPKRKPKTYAYVSDTIFDMQTAKFVEGVDLLYHEATFLDELKGRALETYHTTAKEAGEIASMANAGMLVIGHYSARYREISDLVNEAAQVFENTVGAKEGTIFTL